MISQDVEPVAPEIGSIVPHPPTFRVSELPPGLFPTLIGVFCDRCGNAHEEDVIVHECDEQGQRFEYLRAHLRRRHGWRCNAQGDLCRTCVPPD